MIDWLFYESMLSNNGCMDFCVKDIEYEGTIENVWLDLKGKLTKKHSKKGK